MEIKNTKFTGCVSCHSDENTHGMQCGKCHALALVMSMVHSNWSHDQLEQLGKNLRVGSIFDYTETARGRSAFISARLGDRIISVAGIANMQPDEFRGVVCREIDRHVGEMNGIFAWERKNNREGAYLKHAKEAILSWFGKAGEEKP